MGSFPGEMRLLPLGDRGWLLDLNDATQRRIAWARLEAGLAEWLAPAGPVELVAGERTVALVIDLAWSAAGGDRGSAGSITAERLHQLATQALAVVQPQDRRAALGGSVVEIEVDYDGPDLAGLAASWGWSSQELVAWHSGQLWRVEFTGFMPGFGYLTAEHPRQVPRLPTSRPRIEPGSVGLAGVYSGIYPQASPGGWQLIGRTRAPLWRPERTPPALLVTDGRVRFLPRGRWADG